MPTVSIQFRQEYGDHAAGAVVPFPEALARHLVDCGLATFVARTEPAEPVVERADARPAKNVQRANK